MAITGRRGQSSLVLNLNVHMCVCVCVKSNLAFGNKKCFQFRSHLQSLKINRQGLFWSSSQRRQSGNELRDVHLQFVEEEIEVPHGQQDEDLAPGSCPASHRGEPQRQEKHTVFPLVRPPFQQHSSWIRVRVCSEPLVLLTSKWQTPKLLSSFSSTAVVHSFGHCHTGQILKKAKSGAWSESLMTI